MEPSNTASSLGTNFKSLDPQSQRGIFFCLSLAAFLHHCIESDFIPIIETAVKTECVGVQRTKIVSELAAAMLAACNFPSDKAFTDFFGCDPELLRGITVMLVVTESDAPQKVLDEPSYSRNQNEARTQAVSTVLRILGVSDKGPIGQLNGTEFAKKWNEFSATLVPGVLTGLRRMPQPALIDSTLQRIGTLPPWSRAVVREYMKRMAMEASKSDKAN